MDDRVQGPKVYQALQGGYGVVGVVPPAHVPNVRQAQGALRAARGCGQGGEVCGRAPAPRVRAHPVGVGHPRLQLVHDGAIERALPAP